MRAEEQLDGLHIALARMVWDATPTVRVHYDPGDDTLVAEVVQADPGAEVIVAGRLLLEFDAPGDRAMPVAAYLTGVRAEPGSPAARATRQVLGEEVWATAMALVARGGGRADVVLDPATAQQRRAGWRGLAERAPALAALDPRMFGVEVVPGAVRAVLTDDRTTVLDDLVVPLAENDPDSVVAAIVEAVDRLAARHPGTAAAYCPIGVQLGGPVDTPTGVVEFYDKPLLHGDEAWKHVPLGGLIRRATRREALVFNDAAALAAHEARFGLGRRVGTFAVLVVRDGIGAKLVRNGLLEEDFPLEIGVLVPEHGEGRPTIEASSGVRAIIAAVAERTGLPCRSLADAAARAETSEVARSVFEDAGVRLAGAMAAVQAVVDPEDWAMYAPAELLDDARASGAAFMTGLLASRATRLAWGGFRPSSIEPRPLTSRLGARCAAAAALARR